MSIGNTGCATALRGCGSTSHKAQGKGKKDEEPLRALLRSTFLLLSRLFFTEFLSLVSRHIATIPPTERRTPGNVPEVPFGIGNKDFNDGLKESKYGYPILELYELVKPLTSTEMEAQWGVSIPMGFCYVKKGLWESIWGDDHGGDKVRKVF